MIKAETIHSLLTLARQSRVRHVSMPNAVLKVFLPVLSAVHSIGGKIHLDALERDVSVEVKAPNDKSRVLR